ncbi:MAG: DUF952 domain-containing protein [Planctomycetota bacterium]
MSDAIFHITSRSQWGEAQGSRWYEADSLAAEGFIHFSTEAQVLPSAERFFADRTEDLVVLVIDPDKLTAELRWELAHAGTPDEQAFPHLYGPLNLDAVVDVRPLTRNADSRFASPFAR